MTTSSRAVASALTVVRAGGAALAVLCAGKLLVLFVDVGFDITKSPVVYVLPIAALVTGVVLAGRGRAAGIWTIAVVALLLLALFVVALVNAGLPDLWSDALLVIAGIPVSAAVLAATPAALKRVRTVSLPARPPSRAR